MFHPSVRSSAIARLSLDPTDSVNLVNLNVDYVSPSCVMGEYTWKCVTPPPVRFCIMRLVASQSHFYAVAPFPVCVKRRPCRAVGPRPVTSEPLRGLGVLEYCSKDGSCCDSEEFGRGFIRLQVGVRVLCSAGHPDLPVHDLLSPRCRRLVVVSSRLAWTRLGISARLHVRNWQASPDVFSVLYRRLLAVPRGDLQRKTFEH